MAKTTKTREELIAEANAPKGDAAKQAEAEKEAELDEIEKLVNEPEPPLPDEAEGVLNEPGDYDEKVQKAEEAVKLLASIFGAYSPTAPDEHVVFGNGGGRFTLGHLRALMALVKLR